MHVFNQPPREDWTAFTEATVEPYQTDSMNSFTKNGVKRRGRMQAWIDSSTLRSTDSVSPYSRRRRLNMTEDDAQAYAERWVIDACVDFKLSTSGPEDDFLSIGGTSITLLRLITKAEDELGVTLEPEVVLDAGTPRGRAALLAR
jgi:hypothetical protein